jgi:hypothetical protein
MLYLSQHVINRLVSGYRASGNWLPYDLNGSVHECKQSGTKKVEKTLSLEELDARLKRVESIVIGARK